jgi:capsular polysaccharide transport system ATP-binding protein
MKDLAARANMIIVSHIEGIIKSFCDSAVWLHEGKAHWFDSVRDAMREFGQTQKRKGPPKLRVRPARA